eukprot:scaffold8581_cov109-Isochrysis_galbana.AAC.2
MKRRQGRVHLWVVSVRGAVPICGWCLSVGHVHMRVVSIRGAMPICGPCAAEATACRDVLGRGGGEEGGGRGSGRVRRARCTLVTNVGLPCTYPLLTQACPSRCPEKHASGGWPSVCGGGTLTCPEE